VQPIQVFSCLGIERKYQMIRQYTKGFTLIELIMVIVLVGVLSAMTTDIITLPVKSYLDLERRTALVDTAEIALRRMQRDIRRALPNSIRIKTTANSVVMELLHTVDGGRYRHDTGTGDIACSAVGDNILLFNSADSCFDVIGELVNFSEIDTTNHWLVINNTGSSGANAYEQDNRAALNSSPDFTKTKVFFSKVPPFSSPPLGTAPYRFFIVDTPITYQCDLVKNQLIRYQGYTITSSQANPPPAGKGHLQADKVAACTFTYIKGTSSRSGLVTLEMTLTDSAGESARLVHQIHVDNML